MVRPLAAAVNAGGLTGPLNQRCYLPGPETGRVGEAHAAVYVAGLPWIRTAAFAVSGVGLALIFLQLL